MATCAPPIKLIGQNRELPFDHGGAKSSRAVAFVLDKLHRRANTRRVLVVDGDLGEPTCSSSGPSTSDDCRPAQGSPSGGDSPRWRHGITAALFEPPKNFCRREPVGSRMIGR
jgi:hypothetical protein